MKDYQKIIESLLLKTVSRGATKDEEHQAKSLAAKLAAKHGFSVADIKAKVDSPNFGVSFKTLARRQHSNPFSDFVNWAAADMSRNEWARQAAARANSSPRAEQARKASSRQKARRPRPAQATERTNYNPFGTYGHGVDHEGEYDTVQDFVEEMLKKTTSSYESIAMESQQRFGGKTSAKSVASVACRMRKAGITIPKHRRSK